MALGRWVAWGIGVAVAATGAAAAADYVTHRSGRDEVPARDTQAQGNAVFELSEDGASMSYKVIASNIRNVTAAHIHMAAVGVNGSIVVTLFTGGPPGGGRTDGILAEGVITEASLSGPLAGMPFNALLAEMDGGNTYVNIHTNDGVDPAATGPGDFPGGEIRGQVRPSED